MKLLGRLVLGLAVEESRAAHTEPRCVPESWTTFQNTSPMSSDRGQISRGDTQNPGDSSSKDIWRTRLMLSPPTPPSS
ncbi:uncharacterized protein ASPGLDRAFT_585518 [Aspergillus glaucus CBS 516.65]|uniref:Secreted protein n=1 Tax=Aspergillus glaucus CBS 516.65 TaxID=1160497 RepID=A0A1L9VEE9_ASPGL|nr:hypothetical protein ASPGLDRAFT_585518 [Aspergillus glaucus CBS 516.65]OJJ82265.1 hypothetical protein ASPGLDRAFT_585518 [Aspergillus glaucus CBS 516.65]